MIKMKYIITSILCFGFLSAFAYINPNHSAPASNTQEVSYRMSCAQAVRQTDLDINNVRARLLVGGDVWWDGSSGRYIVPNVQPGEVEVSSIFAGAVWIGGIDPAGNLKLAAQTYGTSNGGSDFWPGPLTEDGTVEDEVCAQWDNFFTVTGAEIDLHIAQFQEAQAAGIDYDVSLIPEGVRGWPGLGNPFFFDIFGFELPTAEQGLGAFFDVDESGDYNPEFGDYPIIEIRNCIEPQYPDEMKFWIYNDAGNIHTETGGDAIQMEIQVQAFAYATNDELNNMTFNRYKLINRAQESIDSTYFAMWVDADLGCFDDDFIGCDTTRSMMYIYNADAVDGSTGDACTGGVETYGDDIPYLGVDYFRGPLAPKVVLPDGTCRNPRIGEPADTIVEIGMTSFLYYNNGGSGTADPAQVDPTNAVEYYNYLTGSWRDGSLVTFGGSGLGGTVPVQFTFPDAPNDNNGWSMCSAGLPEEDRRTIQASGPFRLDPGQLNELIIGVPWVPSVTSYPCPDIGRLQRADDIAQGLFNSCFDIIDGPDAPDVNWLELDQRLVAVLSNEETAASNNSFLQYAERDALAPDILPFDSASYKFEGYLVYQLADVNVAIDELDDPDKARLVFQSDVENNVSTIYNWNEDANPFNPAVSIFSPELQIEASDNGILNSFELTTDIFSGDPLINHTTYFYTAIAYAYNNWMQFDPVTGLGQTTPYLEGRRNIQTYAVTPRPITDRALQANFGDGAVVTRLDGQGVGSNFLVLSKEERERLLENQIGLAGFEGEITYEPGGGPVTVSVVDPLRVLDGEYIIRLDQSAALPTGDSSWELFDANSNESLGRSTQSLENQNEELFPDLGISITIQQSDDAGSLSDNTNGAIGQTISYEDPTQNWLIAVPDNGAGIDGLGGFFDLNFQPTGGGQLNSSLDPSQAYTNLGTGHFAPYTLMDWTTKPNFYATPAWFSPQSAVAQQRNPLSNLNNVDIVYTNDKSKWSRCVVIETGNNYFSQQGFELDDGNANFDVVDRPSVGKEDNDGDGRPDPDGTGTGEAWFPGYAIDVETGERLNIFFGENSAYGDNTLAPEGLLSSVNGSDMMFNPSEQVAFPPAGAPPTAFNLPLGGMHYMYVTRQAYDECAFIKEKLSETLSFRKIDAIIEIAWSGIPIRNPNVALLSYADGLIPTETVVSLRVDSPYAERLGTNDNASFPSYRFELENAQALPVTTEDEINTQLDMINVVPNPYLAFSAYENTQFNNVVKITNLPAQAVVTIYSLDGQFIRQYNRDEVELPSPGANPGVAFSQINPVIEWDLRNAAGIPISSGVYLIHVQAEGLGERVIKWFGVNRQFDPSGL